ncbi:hypothetical protein [Streptomyces daghestanicus]|uniref:hypothetical protein n=1 Tax=Streptomyces daghestanicus TaxID=66885 RepID=UPI00167D9681|nr:hypothetical protein [Streptomyces daghestanicus]
MTRAGTDVFLAELESWTSGDWEDYRARVADGEGSVRAIDAIQRRRRRARSEPPQESTR